MKYTYILLLSLFIYNCKHSSENDLLPYTESGLNNFSCLINGKVFKLKNGNPNTNIHCTYYRDSKNFTLICHLPNSNEAIFFDFSKIELKLGKIDIIRPEKRAWYDDEYNNTHSSISGFLEIKHIDSTSNKRSISGVFEFESSNYKFTNGNFDMKLSLYN